VSTNGGKLLTNQRATIPNHGDLWYNPNAVTNIFSLSEMEKNIYHLQFNQEKAFTVHLSNKEVEFIKRSNGLDYHKPKYNASINKVKTLVNHTIIPITTPATNFIHILIAGVDENVNFAGVA
jgi:hypothetical protein